MKNKLIVLFLLSNIAYVPTVNAATCPLGKDVTHDLANILNIIQIIGPILVFVVTVLEVLKSVSKGDIEGESKKLGQRLLKRVIYCLLLFFVPAIVKMGGSIAQIDVSSCDLSNPSDNSYSSESTAKKVMSTEKLLQKQIQEVDQVIPIVVQIVQVEVVHQQMVMLEQL